MSYLDGQFLPRQPIQFVGGQIGPRKAVVASLSLSFTTSATSTGSTITIPAGAAIGDFAILADFADGGSIPSLVTPTNFNDIASAGVGSAFGGGVNGRGAVSWKILVSGDPGTSVTGMNGGTSNAKVMLVFRPAVTLSSATPNTWDKEINTANPTAQSVTASGGTPPLVVFGVGATDAGTASFSTASPAFDGTVLTSDSDMIFGYKIYNSSPSDHSIDINDLGRNYLASGYVAFT